MNKIDFASFVYAIAIYVFGYLSCWLRNKERSQRQKAKESGK